MRHKKNDKKLGRTTAHRKATVSALVCGLIAEKRIKTTVSKAKVAKRAADRMVTLARKGTLAARRQAVATLNNKDRVGELFENIAPGLSGRQGGYTRIVKLGRRSSDGSEMALLEWVDIAVPDKKKKKQPVEEDQKG